MGDFWGAGDFDAYIWYWSGDPDPNYQLFVFTSDQCGAWSDGCWQDPGFDALYEEQGATFDREQRQQVVFEAQEYVYDQIPGVVLAYPGWLQAYRTDRFDGLGARAGGGRIPAARLQLRLLGRAARRRARPPSRPAAWVCPGGSGSRGSRRSVS